MTLQEDPSGTVWLGGPEGIVALRDGSSRVYVPESLKDNRQQTGVQSIAVESDGSLVVGIGKRGSGLGLQRFRDGLWTTVKLPDFDGSQHRISRVFVDQHGTMWIGTYDDGLYRLSKGTVDHFDRRDGLSGDAVLSIFEDREGSLWVGTTLGLDQFRDLAVQTFSKDVYPKAVEFDNVVTLREGSLWVGGDSTLFSLQPNTNSFTSLGADLKGKQVTSIFEDRAGRVWIGLDNTLNLFANGQFTRVTTTKSQPAGFIVSIAEDTQGRLWALSTGPPRALLLIDPKSMRASIAMSPIDASKIASDAHGGLWIGMNTGDLLHFSERTVVPLRLPHETASRISQLTVMPTGEVLAASEAGLTRVMGGTSQVLSAANGLPCSNLNDFLLDTSGNLWLYMLCGLVEVDQSEFKRWQANPSVKVQVRLFDSSDGVRIHFTPFEGAARSLDGRLWFNNLGALQMIDPEHLHSNATPPLVHIEAIRADFRDYVLAENIKFPALSRDIEISYTGLSFSNPQKVLYRYRLVGFDQQWRDVGSRRQAVYMNLKPGTYTFQLTASNENGIWSTRNDELVFTIPPTFYQTLWFRLLCVVVLFTGIWILFQWRIRRMQVQFNAGLEERIGERTRIARELHDTLLQSFHGLMFQYQAARNMLPRNTEAAIQTLDNAISATEEAIAEGRDAIRDLRPQPAASADLGQQLQAAGEDISATLDCTDSSAAFRVIVEGEPYSLSPLFQDEAYRIGRELLLNAFRHSGASLVEVEIRYDKAHFRLRVRDDGKGLDPDVLAQHGRVGHWGLPGVRERAERMGAQLQFWSEAGAGTEIELNVPTAIAYKQSGNSAFKRFWKAGKS
jgi:signal transduction histidine kinase